MTLAYFDCFSGISGDMTLGALVDAGVSIETLRAELARLGLTGYRLEAGQVKRSGIAATKVDVIVEKEDATPRRLAEVKALINGSTLQQSIKDRSTRIFSRLADAEAKVHGTTPDKVHFHEVGAVDAVVDIVGSVIGLEQLGVTKIMASAVNVGAGAVQTSHGLLPVPAPATAELLRGMPWYQSSTQVELATPTGAAIISTLGTVFGPVPQITADRIAYGAGGRDLPGMPNVLRLLLGEPAAVYEEDTSVLIETNIDDLNPQVYGYLIERLMQQGAQDAFLTPILMKKGRPGTLLSVLTGRARTDAVLDVVFRETTSIGVRIREVGRKKLSRETGVVETIYGKVRVKISRRGSEILTTTPEYEDCRAIAEKRGIPLKTVMDEAKRSAFGGTIDPIPDGGEFP